MADIGAGAPNEQPEMSILEVEEAAGNEAHPRHAEAKRILEDTVGPFLDTLQRSILPTLRGGFSMSTGSDSDEPGPLDRPGHELQRNLEQAQRQVDTAIRAQQDEMAREKGCGAGSAGEGQRRESPSASSDAGLDDRELRYRGVRRRHRRGRALFLRRMTSTPGMDDTTGARVPVF